jgi:hypothetical protein
MRVLRSVLIIAFAAAATNGQQTSPPPSAPPPVPVVPASCPVTTRPERPFIPPADYRNGEELPKNFFWIGTNELWTGILEHQYWYWRPHKPGHEQDLTQKIFWFRETYNWHKEPIPKLRVTGKRIDGPSPPLMNPQGPATNAIMDENHGAMLTGVYLPAPGCWEITGDYEGTKLSFVVWVVPLPGADQAVPAGAKNTEER